MYGATLSFQKGEYPTKCKRADGNPIYKKDDNQYKENYRPISLLPSISKISEKNRDSTGDSTVC